MEVSLDTAFSHLRLYGILAYIPPLAKPVSLKLTLVMPCLARSSYMVMTSAAEVMARLTVTGIEAIFSVVCTAPKDSMYRGISPDVSEAGSSLSSPLPTR